MNGRPLPTFIRRQIVEMAESGIRPCDISRQLLVSHGCVSKILSRYYETGCLSPGSVNVGPRQKNFAPLVQRKIIKYRQQNPQASAVDVQEMLLDHRGL